MIADLRGIRCVSPGKLFYDSGINFVSRSVAVRVECNKRHFDFRASHRIEKPGKLAMEERGVL